MDNARRFLPHAAAVDHPANPFPFRPEQLFHQDRTHAPTASSLASPLGVAGDKAGNLYVADLNNSRVLQFRPPFSNGMNASLVLGQNDFTSGARVVTRNGMSDPAGVTVDSQGNVFVADQDANRVTEYSSPLSNGENAAIVIGQPDFTSSTMGTTQNTLNSPQGLVVEP